MASLLLFTLLSTKAFKHICPPFFQSGDLHGFADLAGKREDTNPLCGIFRGVSTKKRLAAVHGCANDQI